MQLKILTILIIIFVKYINYLFYHRINLLIQFVKYILNKIIQK